MNNTDTDAPKDRKKKMPPNVKRAIAYRRYAETRAADVRLLAKWLHTDTAENGRPISELSGRVAELIDLAIEIADAYEALAPESMVTRKGAPKKTIFGKGDIVRVKPSKAALYKAMTTSPDQLTVLDAGSKHILVADTAGTRLFIMRNDLELADGSDDDSDDDSED